MKVLGASLFFAARLIFMFLVYVKNFSKTTANYRHDVFLFVY